MKCYLRYVSKRSYKYVRNLWQFKKIYITNLVQNQFRWIVDCGFNGIKHIFIKSFDSIAFGFSRVFSLNVKICINGGWLAIRHQVQVFQEFS